jgi:hypothetical protein
VHRDSLPLHLNLWGLWNSHSLEKFGLWMSQPEIYGLIHNV